MKKLLLIFVTLLGIAVFATVAGILVSRRSRGTRGNGATVLVWKVDGPVLEQEVPALAHRAVQALRGELGP